MKNEKGEEVKDDTEDSVAISKIELEKLRKDHDTYREGVLHYKTKEKELISKKIDSDTTTIDEDQKIKQIVEQTSASIFGKIEQSNEKKAKVLFLKKNPEYFDDTNWADLMTFYAGRRGKIDSDEITSDLEDAVLLHKKSSGKLDEYLSTERERGRREGVLSAGVYSAGSAGGVGDVGSGGKASVKINEDMARAFHNDPEKVAEIPDGREFTIDIFKKK